MTDFKQELRQLIDRHITPSSRFRDYLRVIRDLEGEAKRLPREADRKFSIEEMEDEMDKEAK